MDGTWRWASTEEWDHHARASPCATPFHTRAWCEAYASYSPRHRPRALIFGLDGGRQALLPVFVRDGFLRRGPFARTVSARPGVYGGPIALDGALGPEGWRAFARRLPHLPVGSWECFGNVLDPSAPSPVEGLATDSRSTQVVDVASLPPDPVTSYEANCRRNVRKAEREGVVVARERGVSVLAEYAAMYAASQARWGQDPARGYRSRLFEILHEAGCAELWTARTREGALAAGGWFVVAPRHVVYWHGAMHEEHASLRPANALHHALILEARRRGARYYDFNPSNDLEGVEQFKRSFGARAIEFPTLRWTPGALRRLSRWLGRAGTSGA